MTHDPEFFECELHPVPAESAKAAISQVSGCERCSEDAEIPFDWILAETMNRPGMFEFLLETLSRCPTCGELMTEKTLVLREG